MQEINRRAGELHNQKRTAVEQEARLVKLSCAAANHSETASSVVRVVDIGNVHNDKLVFGLFSRPCVL